MSEPRKYHDVTNERWSVAYSDPAEGVNCFWIMNGAMVVGSVDGPQSDGRQGDRARLIAAAPDMLEALREIRGWREIGTDDFLRRIEQIADAAINKAVPEVDKQNDTT